MRLIIIIGLFVLQGSTLTAQFARREFRTVREDDMPNHYLKILPNGSATVRFPVNHGEAMLGRRQEIHELKYKINGDTLRFFQSDAFGTPNKVIGRFLNGVFLINSRNFISDIRSGYPYVTRRVAAENVLVLVLNGKIFRQKLSRTNRYSVLTKYFQQNRKLKKAMMKLDTSNYDSRIVKGLNAYKKYGLDGMNGVIEFERKN